VLAAVYLEEFAPRNRWTDAIEVSINNLAAVPSIIFGLLGLAVFLNVMNLPRSAPLVGGLTLALMTMPVIVIAGRNAIKSVPPSIRDAALGVGASKMQVTFHHALSAAGDPDERKNADHARDAGADDLRSDCSGCAGAGALDCQRGCDAASRGA
jgi:ABC-type phosphate transport system permease subunit